MPSETVSEPHPWLQGFPTHQRVVVSAWFGYAVSQGARRPEVMIDMVQRLVASKLEWSVSPTSVQICEATLASLAHHRGQALAYAQTMLDASQKGARL